MIRIELKGVDKTVEILRAIAGATPEHLAGALYEDGEELRTESQTLVPVDTGVLKNSAFVNTPQTDSQGTYVTVGYGGAAKDYAVVQHEDLTLFHDDGQAKYLEQPFLERAKGLAERLAAKVKARVGL